LESPISSEEGITPDFTRDSSFFQVAPKEPKLKLCCYNMPNQAVINKKAEVVDLSIIIVNYNVKYHLGESLQSIYGNRKGISFEIIVVDNDSTDGSVDMVKSRFTEVRLIENCQNLGFARAVNQGLIESKGRYLLLLNPDTVVLPGALDKMVEFMDENPRAGALGCKLLNADGSLQPSCRSFPTLRGAFFENIGLERLFPGNRVIGQYRMGYWGHNCVREVDQPMGANLMLRSAAISQVGLMDEQFYMYYEEVDWCYRIKKEGWKIYFTPYAEMIHYGGKSTRQAVRNMLIERYRSMHKFYRKHFGLIPEILLKCMNFVGLVLKILFGATIVGVSLFGRNRKGEYWEYRRQILRDRWWVLVRNWRLWV